MDQADLIWQNGELVAWEDAKVHVLTHGLHYGTGVFEGVRAYETERGPAIFRHTEHIDRLFQSARLYYMDIPYTPEELRLASHELLAANGLRECYIRPIAFRGYGSMGLNPLAMFMSAALMLRHGFGWEEQAAAVESAVDRALAEGLRTRDLGGTASTREATRAVLKLI